MKPTTDSVVSSALRDISSAALIAEAQWALVGGQSLLAYGVPRQTLDVDILVDADALEEVAVVLVDSLGWTPLLYDPESGDMLPAREVSVHFMDDPVLFDMQEERRMIPLESPAGLPLDLLAAQHTFEREMIDRAALVVHHDVQIPIAPLGGVLLVKTKAHREKDILAIAQVAEHLSRVVLDEAVSWAGKRDPSTAEDLSALLHASRSRRVPTRTVTYTERKKTPHGKR